jgi:hypothetical protein
MGLTIGLFGVSGTNGPLQVVLLRSVAQPSRIGFKDEYSSAEVAGASRHHRRAISRPR